MSNFNISSVIMGLEPFQRIIYFIDVPTEDSWSALDGRYVRNVENLRRIEIPRDLANYIHSLRSENVNLRHELDKINFSYTSDLLDNATSM